MSELLTAAAKPVHPADDIEPTPQAEVVLEPASPIAEIEVPPGPDADHRTRGRFLALRPRCRQAVGGRVSRCPCAESS